MLMNVVKITSGKEYVEERTSSCEYHFHESVRKHAKFVTDVDRYYNLINEMKHALTKEAYLEKKSAFDDLINEQPESRRNSLVCFLRFWNERTFRWVPAYRKHSCGIPKSSLAEAAHAKMKSAGRKNLSLAASAIEDIEDAAMLEALWRRRLNGGKSTGTGPTGIQNYSIWYQNLSFIFLPVFK